MTSGDQLVDNLGEMVNLGVHPIRIVEDGRLVGLISRNDVLSALLNAEVESRP